MDQLQASVTQLTGAVNNILEQLTSLESRLAQAERRNSTVSVGTFLSQLHACERRIALMEGSGSANVTVPLVEPETLRGPTNESELRDISKLPDSVKELQIFDGNPVHFVSWVHSVETILKDYEIVKSKPIYRAILQHIRQKIRGKADAALVSYNIFDNGWTEIKRVLSLHYADKRDLRTLEHQLNSLKQGSSKVDEFYATVNHQFSLVINKLRMETYSAETLDAMIETYRNRALDVFVRGLNGDLSRLLIIQKPKALPEAYAACLEMQNLNFRNNSLHVQAANSISAPVHYNFKVERPPLPARQPGYQGRPHSNRYTQNRSYTPPRPSGFKPAIKMEVDGSLQSRHVNYMNYPNRSYNPFKREGGNYSGNFPSKQQRMNHISTVPGVVEENEPQKPSSQEEENFMAGASSLAYHI